ncbi:GNAT family N-acetyltransferase [Streptomyces agglomeratus]|uniref:GNAT family N-acetyltransferase n=1 Tax=Streptomyces agglomeratus TaxID=285458 RepID=A0A1E5PI09_9ACTN|nr:GNAT family N-acetyltransferase [Streptomyces agglomeratus]OEJ29198.1 GNAT family N-acetyltransferase [Streptomyces agglomeratus]OEJ48685.1 GNAT family N-acetyltransferase [Streptomyces agglomeratus]OEJ56112.1 GNAT family N-acetyltransferase [Streptomyces agglomeratus]OEJ63504.1 GNAT family N-acetyltransferase [Streptomyces agglomeratus]
MIEVRHAGPNDGHVLGEIHAAAWEVAYAPFFEPEFAARAVQSRRTRWHERIADGRGTILLAVVDDRPLALSVFLPSETRHGLAEICSFYSHPDGWGSGVAAALMTGTLRRLREDGFARVHLWTLRDTPQSRRFYTKCGFTETGAARAFDFGDGNALDQVEYERAC